MKVWWMVIWGILTISFLGSFLNGWYSNDLLDQIFLGLLAIGSALGFYKSVID